MFSVSCSSAFIRADSSICAPGDLAEPLAQPARDEREQRQHHEPQQGQAPVEGEHHEERGHHRDEVRDDVDDASS